MHELTAANLRGQCHGCDGTLVCGGVCLVAGLRVDSWLLPSYDQGTFAQQHRQHWSLAWSHSLQTTATQAGSLAWSTNL